MLQGHNIVGFGGPRLGKKGAAATGALLAVFGSLLVLILYWISFFQDSQVRKYLVGPMGHSTVMESEPGKKIGPRQSSISENPERPDSPQQPDVAGAAMISATDGLAGTIHIARNSPNVDAMVAEEGAPFYPSRITTDGKQLTPEMFVKSESCNECHVEIYEQWSSSIMGHSWEDPIYRAILARASTATEGATDNFCMGCHTPIGLTTGTATAVGSQKAASSGVDCQSCHTISNITGLGNGSLVLTPFTDGRPVKFGPRKDALSPFHDTAYSELHTKAEFCATCHNVTHPFNRFSVERTYDEWRDSPYNGAGIVCQDCHMTPGPGVTENPGTSALGGKERPHVYSHRFTGGNVTLHKYYGEAEQAERARKMLQSAATIEFVKAPRVVKVGQNITIQIKVANVGAGHKLPTGFPEGREVWIDFQAKDAHGKQIYRLGAIKDGHTEKGTKSFKAVLGDPNGNIVDINVWEADRVLSDTRILPKGYAQVEYTFPVPTDVSDYLTIVADLNYMSFPQHILDKLFGKDKMKSEIVLMGSVKYTVKVEKPLRTTARKANGKATALAGR